MIKTIAKLGITITLTIIFRIVEAQDYFPYTILGTTTISGTENDKFNSPSGITVASDGKIYIVDNGNNRISVWTTNGANFGNLTTFGSSGSGSSNLSSPFKVTISNDGKIYISDFVNNRISVWTGSGSNYENITTFGTRGTQNNQFRAPYEVAIAPDGKLYITDQINSRISVWTIIGNTFGNLTTFGSFGSNNNQFNFPSGISISEDGKIFISDSENNRISVWTTNGVNYGNLSTFGRKGSQLDQFFFPSDIKIFPDGRIFVADTYNHRISVFTMNGSNFTNILTFGGRGSGMQSFNNPNSISISKNGYLFITEEINHRVNVWLNLYPSTNIPSSTKNTSDGSITLNGIVGNSCNPVYKSFSASVSGTFMIKSASNLCVASSTTYNWYFDNNTTFTEDDILISTPNSTDTSISLSGMNLSVGGYYVSISTCKTRLQPMPMAGFMEMAYYPTQNSETYYFIPNASIVSQPMNKSICEGNTIDLDVQVSGTMPRYIWNNGSTSPNINTTIGIYMATINGLCNSIISNSATISGLLNTFILSQPISKTFCSGTNMSFSISATGSNLSYLWSNGLSNSNIMTTSSVGINQNVTVSGSCGIAISNSFNIENYQNLEYTSPPSTSETICGGNVARFEIHATGSGLRTIWSTGETTSGINVSVAGLYSVTSSGFCGIPKIENIELGITPKTSIIQQPVSQTACRGTNITFNVSATGNNLSYAWNNGLSSNYKMTTSLSGNYFVTITGTCGTEVSNGFSYSQLEPLNIVLPPSDKVILPEQKTSLSVSATGLNILYQWNTGDNTPTISNLGEGDYSVTITGTCGYFEYFSSIFEIPIPTVIGIYTLYDVISITSPINITINGSGFEQNVLVTINGVVLPVVMVMPNSIVVSLAEGIIKNDRVANITVQNPNQTPSSISVIIPTIISTSFNQNEINRYNNISIHPNPSQNSTFSINNVKKATQLVVFNPTGNLVYSKEIDEGSSIINTSLPPGIYLVKVGSKILKIVLE